MLDQNVANGEVSLDAEELEVRADLECRVEKALEYVRPFLKVDGGDVELVRIDFAAKVVEVCLTGACKTCSLAQMTLRAGIERSVLREAPEIVRVESVARPEPKLAIFKA